MATFVRIQTPLEMLIIFTTIFSNVNALDITNTGGYRGIIVAVDEDVQEDLDVLRSLQKTISASSSLMYKATDRRAYFEDVTISVPSSWTSVHKEYGATSDNVIREVRSETPHIRIGSHASHGNVPYARQIGGCGEPGMYIHVTPEFLKHQQQHRHHQAYTTGDFIFTQEWAKYRYGIFSEHGIPGDPMYSLFYWRHNKVKPNIGIEEIGGWARTIDGKKCKMYRGGVVDSNCRFVISSRNNSLTKFILEALPFKSTLEETGLWPDDVYITHDDESPSPQNVLCNHRSSWSMLANAWDFRRVTHRLKSLEPPEVHFQISKEKSTAVKPHLKRFDRYMAVYIPDKLLVQEVDANVSGSKESIEVEAESLKDMYSENEKNGNDMLKLSEEEIRISLPQALQILFSKTYSNASLPRYGYQDFYQWIMDDKIISHASIITAVLPDEIGSSNKKDSTRVRNVIYKLLLREASRNRRLHMNSIIIRTSSRSSRSSVILGKESLRREFPLERNRKILDVENNTTTPTNDISLWKRIESAIFDILDTQGYRENNWIFVLQAEGVTVLKLENVSKSHLIDERSSTKSVGVMESKAIAIGKWIHFVPMFPWRAYRLLVEVKIGANVVLDATVRAFVKKPGSEEIDELQLRDDGIGGDIFKHDGVYSAYFTNFSENGRYDVTFQIDGAKGKSRVKLIREYSSSSSAYLLEDDLTETPSGNPSTYFTLEDFDIVNALAPEPEITATPLPEDFRILTEGGSFYLKHWNQSKEDYLPPSKIRDLRIMDVTKANGILTIEAEWTSTGAFLGREPAGSLEMRIAPPTLNLRRQFECGIEINSSFLAVGTLDPLSPGETHRLIFNVPEELIQYPFGKLDHVEDIRNNKDYAVNPVCYRKRFLDLSGLLDGVQIGIKVGNSDTGNGSGTTSTSNIAYFSLNDVRDNIHTVGDALGVDKKITTIVAAVVVGAIQLAIIIVMIRHYRKAFFGCNNKPKKLTESTENE